MTDQPARAKILYMDDDPVLRGTVSLILEQQGFQVQTASNGSEGVQMALEWLPHLILMDLMMPVMNGFQAAEALRADPSTRHIPIVAFSAAAEESIPARTRAAGMNGLILKPVAPKRLASIIRGYLPSSG